MEPISQVLTYARVSTDDQSLGLEAQRRTLSEQCAAKEWVVVGHYEDDGLSGSLPPDKRPGLTQAVDRLNAGEAEALVVAKLDRLSRSVLHFATFVDEAARHKPSWRISVLDIGADITTPQGEFMAHLMVIVAQLERSLIATRTREALAERRAQGQRLGRPAQLNPLIWARIHAEYQTGLTAYAIAKALNADQVPTAHGGKRWHEATVRKILLRGPAP